MRLRSLATSLCALVLFAAPIAAQNIDNPTIDRFIAGTKAENVELSKVSTQTKELDRKIKEWRECYAQLREIGQVTGTSPSGFKAKAVTRAKCGATSDEGLVEERQKLLENPEETGARAAGMSREDYARMKEKTIEFLGGSRNFGDDEIKVLAARATELSNALGVQYVRGGNGGGRSGGGISGAIGNALGNAVASQIRMFTPDMTWAYVTYLNGILYLSGATMFESDYKPGEWTSWEINDASQPDQKMILERAMIRRDADKTELWRTKTISITAEKADTIILETQMKPQDADGVTMTVVRMRGKFPGDTAGKELMVPEDMHTISPQAFGRKPTPESVAGATVGMEPVKVGSTTYVAKHVRFGSGGGDMDWWMSERAPGGLVKITSTANGKDSMWTMELTGSGKGAKSELGMK